MTILMLFIYFWFISAACKALKTAASRTKARRQLKRQAAAYTITRQQQSTTAAEKDEARRKKEIEQIQRKEQLIQAKERAAAEKRRQQERKEAEKKGQAQNDLLYINDQLQAVSDMLENAYTELETINDKIKIDVATRQYDSEIRDRKQRERIQKRVLMYESKIHTLETKAAREKFILEN